MRTHPPPTDPKVDDPVKRLDELIEKIAQVKARIDESHRHGSEDLETIRVDVEAIRERLKKGDPQGRSHLKDFAMIAAIVSAADKIFELVS